MIERYLRCRIHIFLAIVASLSLSLQTAGHFSFTEATTGTIRCEGASLVRVSTLPTDPAGEEPRWDGHSSTEPLFLVPVPPGSALTQQRRILATARTSLAQGFPVEICRPPISTV